MKINRMILLFLMSCYSTISHAHTGHDHSSFFAIIIHTLWIAPVMIIAAICYQRNLMKNYRIKAKNEKAIHEGT